MKKVLLGLVALIFGATLWICFPRGIVGIASVELSADPWLTEIIQRDIVIVVEDQKTKDACGELSLAEKRKRTARLIRIVNAAEPRAIALDFFFGAATEADVELQNALDETCGNTVWGREDHPSRFKRRIPAFGMDLPLGHIIAALGIPEHPHCIAVPVCIKMDNKAVPAFAFAVLETALGASSVSNGGAHWNGSGLPIQMKYGNDVWVDMNYSQIPTITVKIPTHGTQKAMPVCFVGKEGFFRRFSLVDVLDGRIDAKKLCRKIVLVGSSLPEDHDRHMTEVGEMDGVEIQANAVATIMEALAFKK